MFFLYNIRFFAVEVGDTDGFIQLVPGLFKSDKTINITGTDKILLNCDCIIGSIVNGVRKPILFCFALEKPPGNKKYKDPSFKLFKKMKKSQITFYLEDNSHEWVHFNGATISFFAL